MKGGLLVAGTTSDAGKTVLTTALCRWLSRQGVAVAPYKAQNMSNNSMVTADGAEIGRAQWVQAVAAGAEPEAAMNPVLLKPGSDRRSHVVVMGRSSGELDAASFAGERSALAEAAYAAFDDLRTRYDVVVCEGAGSPAEINLRRFDYVNMGLAQHGRLPTLVIGDIDRGGVFASMFGTLALLDAADQALVSGFVVNKFRGDRTLLAPGLDMLSAVTGRRVLGVLPWQQDLWLDSEDALDLDGRRASWAVDDEVLRVAVVRLPRISNFTDVDALGLEPNVDVRFISGPGGLADADLVVLPGTRATVEDLAWLRAHGFEQPLRRRVAAGLPVLGICGGFQMLGETVDDPTGVESAQRRRVPGLGLLPVHTTFGAQKRLGTPSGSWRGMPVSGYEIHHGTVRVRAGEPFLDGCRSGAAWGTLWHGALESDAFRRALLAELAQQAGRTGFTPRADTSLAEARAQRLDLLGDLVAEHLDTETLLQLIEHGAPGGMRCVPPGAP
ncbi:MAG TPA: cobyric acid synthase [Nocardioidaceae bacterium]|nr:cobyric acid synthase [Nocardioidaceae bacterium]